MSGIKNSLFLCFLVLFFLVHADGCAGNVPEKKRGNRPFENYLKTRQSDILREFAQLLSLPNVKGDSTGLSRNADFIAGMLKKRKIQVRLLHEKDVPPVVYGSIHFPGTTKTLLVYAHYDGQPVDPAQWRSNPWTPVLREKPLPEKSAEIFPSDLRENAGPEWRLYARSSADDKAPIMAVVAAIDFLTLRKLVPSVNLKFLFEGEEEAGSPHLPALLGRYKELFQADGMILCDGPVHQSRSMQLVFGARGITTLEMTAYGPNRPLHSGHYGNWAPNPLAVLAGLMAKMRDAEGTILIPGFYDDVRPLTPVEKDAIVAMPDIDDEIRKTFGLAASEAENEPLAKRVMLPALNFRGIASGHVRLQAENAVPARAQVSIDFRLVPDQTPEKVKAEVEGFLVRQGYYLVHEEPDQSMRLQHARILKLEWGNGYPPARTPLDHPFSRALTRAVENALGNPVIKVPGLGGSIPMCWFQNDLDLPVVIFPIANHDNNQHGPDENLRLQNLWDAIGAFSALFTDLGRFWR